MLAITQAESVIGDWRLNECELYVTKEPCPMCAGAIVHVRFKRVIFGCPSPKDGAAGSLINLIQHPKLNHRALLTSGVRQEECAQMLQAFFRERRGEAGRRTAPGVILASTTGSAYNRRSCRSGNAPGRLPRKRRARILVPQKRRRASAASISADENW